MNKFRRTTISVIAAVLFALALPAAASAFVVASPTSLTYPDRTVGTQSDPQTVTVVVQCVPFMAMCAPGTDDTFTPNPTFTGAHPGDFSQTNNCGPSKSNTGLAPGVCQFFVIFKPTAQGTRTATLILGTSTSGNGPPPISLSGVGILPPPTTTTPAATGQRDAALAKCKKKRSKKARKKCKKKANLLPV